MPIRRTFLLCRQKWRDEMPYIGNDGSMPEISFNATAAGTPF